MVLLGHCATGACTTCWLAPDWTDASWVLLAPAWIFSWFLFGVSDGVCSEVVGLVVSTVGTSVVWAAHEGLPCSFGRSLSPSRPHRNVRHVFSPPWPVPILFFLVGMVSSWPELLLLRGKGHAFLCCNTELAAPALPASSSLLFQLVHTAALVALWLSGVVSYNAGQVTVGQDWSPLTQ